MDEGGEAALLLVDEAEDWGQGTVAVELPAGRGPRDRIHPAAGSRGAIASATDESLGSLPAAVLIGTRAPAKLYARSA